MPRATDWVDTIVGNLAVTGSQANISLITGLDPSDMRGATVIRTLIRLNLASDTTAGAWGWGRVDMAIGISAQEAFTAGVLPDPNIDGDKPPRGWMWRDSVGVSQNGVGGQVVVPVRADIRGARKVENGEVYLIYTNTAVDGTTFSVRCHGLVRLLIKLA